MQTVFFQSNFENKLKLQNIFENPVTILGTQRKVFFTDERQIEPQTF